MLEQILSSNTARNVWRTVRRSCMLMLGLKRLSVFNKYKGVVLIIRTFFKATSSPLTRIQTCGFLNTAYFSLRLLSISLFCESHGQLETTSTTDSWSSRRRSKDQNTNKIKVEVKVRQKGRQKHATCFSTLLQNEMNNDFVPPTNKTCHTTNQLVAGCEKLLQRIGRSSNICNKTCPCCAFYQPKANLFCSKWRKFFLWRNSREILGNQGLVFAQLATTWFVAGRFKRGCENSQHRLSTRFAAMLQNKLHVKWKFSACTYTWYYLFFKISQNEIWKFGRNLLLAKFGSERVKMFFLGISAGASAEQTSSTITSTNLYWAEEFFQSKPNWDLARNHFYASSSCRLPRPSMFDQ